MCVQYICTCNEVIVQKCIGRCARATINKSLHCTHVLTYGLGMDRSAGINYKREDQIVLVIKGHSPTC